MGVSGCCGRRRPPPAVPPSSSRRRIALAAALAALLLVAQGTSVAGFAAPAPQLKQYYASCSQGLAEVLEQELLGPEIGAAKTEALKRGVRFLGDEATGYRALIHSRVGNGVWQLMARQRRIRGREDIYTLASRVDWKDAMRVDQTVGVQCVIGEGVPPDISHSHYSALTVKNAVVDQFREDTGQRPNVDPDNPDLPLVVFLQRDEAWLYRSLSGFGSLHKRGYRDCMHRSSLRETLAAAMLLFAGYDPDKDVLLDPMCGSGTIAIEAALKARRIAPGLVRVRKARDLGVLVPARWPDTDVELLKEVVREARERERDAPLPIMANDVHPGAFQLALKDAISAGVDGSIDFSNMDADDLQPLHKPTLVVSNPPWDLRLSEGAAESWEAMGRFLKREAGGGTAWLLSGNPSITQGLRMKVERKVPIDQAGLSLRLLKYSVLPPKPRAEDTAAAPTAPGEPAPADRPAAEDAVPAKPKRGRPRKTPVPPSSPPPPAASSSQGSASVRAGVSRHGVLSSAAGAIMGAFLALGTPARRGDGIIASAKASDALSTATERLRDDYDGYSSGYDALDGGPLVEWLGLDAARAQLVGRARGRVLECGVGTGLNLPFYQRGGRVESLDAIDLSPGMLRRARAKADGLGLGLAPAMVDGQDGAAFPVHFHERDVARLEGFASGSFDSVVDTFSLCVYPDPVGALREMGRVVKPASQGGRVQLLENSRSKQPLLGAYQDATAQTLARDFGGKGCVWNQDVEALARQAGLRVVASRPIAGGLFTMLECSRD